MTAGDFFDDALFLCERFGRDARLGSVDRDHGSVDTPKDPKPSTLRRSRGGSGSPDGGTCDERESADESPSRRRRLDRDGAFARRGETRNISRPAKSNSETYSPAKSNSDAPMHDALSDFGPLMDLLEGRPATAVAPSGQRSENPSRRATRRAARSPRAASLFADDPRDSVAAAGDGRRGFPRHSSKSTRVETNERFHENAGEETHGVGFLDGLLVDAVDDVLGPRRKARRSFLRDCAHASVAPRITPPTPRRDTGLDPAAPAFAPRSIASSRYGGVPRTNKGRLIAPRVHGRALRPSGAPRDVGRSRGDAPSAREVPRLVDAVAETQTRIGVPPFA